MVIELEMLQEKLALFPDFPVELKTLLEHLIISHHGQYEFGSPKLPMFPEALLLHYMDDLDSKMESVRAHFERESENESPWTSYNASLGRPLLNSAKFLAPKPPDIPAAAVVLAESVVVESENLNLPGLETPNEAEPAPVSASQPKAAS